MADLSTPSSLKALSLLLTALTGPSRIDEKRRKEWKETQKGISSDFEKAIPTPQGYPKKEFELPYPPDMMPMAGPVRMLRGHGKLSGPFTMKFADPYFDLEASKVPPKLLQALVNPERGQAIFLQGMKPDSFVWHEEAMKELKKALGFMFEPKEWSHVRRAPYVKGSPTEKLARLKAGGQDPIPNTTMTSPEVNAQGKPIDMFSELRAMNRIEDIMKELGWIDKATPLDRQAFWNTSSHTKR